MPKIEVFRIDDWEWVFLDGELIDEDHSMDEQMVLEKILGEENVIYTDVEFEIGWGRIPEFSLEFERQGKATPEAMRAFIAQKREENESG